MCPIAEKRAETIQPIFPRYPTLQFDELVGHLKVCFSLLPDARKGHNVTYRIQDAALGAFSVFFTQCPSFLAHQKHLQETKGQNNSSFKFEAH